MPHSWANIEDMGRAADLLATREEAFSEVWITPHAVPVTQGKAVEMICQTLGIEPQFSVLSPLMMRLGGLFIPAVRASVEMMCEFSEPFVVDRRKFEQTFWVKAIPIEEGIRKIAEWYRAKAN